ncbi:Nucleic-acid-binding protein from transposon X-element [Eumeta japonica]|uniref:Nucleic-acid-binding protein from transposon X-element n=1 Tax=Eumeta variegata TaxID=151549 RepID=A0A4C1XR96_EUMVA|nr:Nucleic-acid-binding protein from transposon X-element [Eumeta japonica]
MDPRESRPVSALNGRATAPGKCVSYELLVSFSVCSVLQLTHAAPRSPACGVAPSVACASCSARVVAFCGLPHRAPRPPRPPSISFYHTTRPARRAVVASHHLRCCGSVRHRPNTLAATAMDKAKAFLTERPPRPAGVRGILLFPASPDPQVVVFDPEMDLEYTLPRASNKRSANARPSEGTSSDSESDPGSGDSSDHSGFTTVRRRRAAKGSKPKAAGLTQTSDGSMCYRLTPAPRKPKKANVAKATPSGKSTSSIYASPVSWRTPSQPAAAPQGAVDDGGVKAAAPAAAKNSRGDEADVTAPPTPAPRGPKPPPMFVQDKDRWTELRRRCADKGIQFSQARNSVQGLKLQAKTVADFKNLQNLLVCYKFKFHTYSLKEEREIRVVLRGVPKEIPVDEVKEDLVAQSLPVQSVRRILNRFRKPLDLVLVSGTAEANDKATKAAFFKIRSVCSLSPASKRSSPANAPYPGSVTTASPTGIRPVFAFIQRVALSAWATTAQRNAHAIRTQTVHPPVSCANRRAIRPTTLDARVLQRDPLHPRRPCRAERLRAQSRRHSAMLERRLDRVTPRPPQRTLLHPLTI